MAFRRSGVRIPSGPPNCPLLHNADPHNADRHTQSYATVCRKPYSARSLEPGVADFVSQVAFVTRGLVRPARRSVATPASTHRYRVTRVCARAALRTFSGLNDRVPIRDELCFLPCDQLST